MCICPQDVTGLTKVFFSSCFVSSERLEAWKTEKFKKTNHYIFPQVLSSLSSCTFIFWTFGGAYNVMLVTTEQPCFTLRPSSLKVDFVPLEYFTIFDSM